jgi:hypothetical protein
VNARSRLDALERLLTTVPSAGSVWSTAPQDRSTTMADTLRHAAAREVKLAQLRRSTDRSKERQLRVVRVPGGAGRGRRSAGLAWLRGGVVAGLSDPTSPTVADQLLIDAHLAPPEDVAVGRDGAVLLRTHRHDGLPVVVRVGSGSADPRPAARALRWLALPEPTIPSIVSVGVTASLGWTVETRLPGRRPERLDAAVADQVSGLLLRLPHDDAPPTSWEEDLATLARADPAVTAAVTALRDELMPVLARLPSVVRHGDLWRGNLLVDQGRLVGLVDWDAIHTGAPPGVDLLQLLTTELRGRGRGLGTVFRSRPWRDPEIRQRIDGHLHALGVTTEGPVLDALATCWWSQEVAGTLRRLPERAVDRRWWETNVRDVLRALAADGDPTTGAGSTRVP